MRTGVAQLVEQLIPNQQVGGSSPPARVQIQQTLRESASTTGPGMLPTRIAAAAAPGSESEGMQPDVLTHDRRYTMTRPEIVKRSRLLS